MSDVISDSLSRCSCRSSELIKSRYIRHHKMMKYAPSPNTASISSSGTPLVSGYTVVKLI